MESQLGVSTLDEACPRGLQQEPQWSGDVAHVRQSPFYLSRPKRFGFKV